MARKTEGRFTVTGPNNKEGTAENLGMAILKACTYANDHRKEEGEFTYYIRDITGKGFGGVTKHSDGVITVACAAS